MKPYQFAFHERVPKEPPVNSDFDLVASGKKLTREEKDRIFFICRNQGNESGNYKVSGWCFPFGSYMNTYLVKYQYYGWQEIKAFDKTCIRNCDYIKDHIIKIVEFKID
jgi:hypothetical protein